MGTAQALRAAWREGKPVFGGWAVLPTPFSVELMAHTGVGYICVDQQHGLIDYAQTLDMYRAAEGRGVAPFTRVPANEGWMIGKALDAGAQGVIVPMVNTREQAAAAVQACRYPPAGVRSYGPVRAALVSATRDTQALGNNVLCFVMVETREALQNIDQIASTPGLDGIYIGPADLALGLGLPPDLDKTEAEHVAAVEQIYQACRRHGIVAGIQCASGKSGRAYAERGFGLITVIKDSALLQAGARQEIRAALGDAGSPAQAQGYT
ncbi:HpcH/HpaI aldolase family protein [Pigmentiphaga humi]|uniref:HpcH/HpaI aldolase family protein n=1 Tax=Pigmentiphaga humi TaxID=2478468 RepID=UPI000F54637C|nr:aldolase/citrate lyase family protein [Pigmentiphaga humi]